MLFATPVLTIYILLLQAVFGAVLASFLGCFAWRVCHGEAVLKGRSHCDACGHVFGGKDLVPVVRYLSTKGSCRYCGKKISKLCLYGELALAGLFVLATLRFDLTAELFLANCFLCTLYVVTLTDFYEQIILDRCILFAVAIRFLVFFCSGQVSLNAFLTLLGNGLAIAGPILLLTLVLEYVLKKEALGGGDIKLLFVMGLYLGWANCLILLFVACIAGIIYGAGQMKKEDGKEEGSMIPFGPFLSLGAVVALLVGDSIVTWYMSLFL